MCLPHSAVLVCRTSAYLRAGPFCGVHSRQSLRRRGTRAVAPGSRKRIICHLPLLAQTTQVEGNFLRERKRKVVHKAGRATAAGDTAYILMEGNRLFLPAQQTKDGSRKRRNHQSGPKRSDGSRQGPPHPGLHQDAERKKP